MPLSLDPHSATALIALGWAHWHHGFFRTGPSPDQALASAGEAGTKALEIDHLNHRAHLVKAIAYRVMTRHDDALDEGRRAHDVNPNDCDTLVVLGGIEARSGQPVVCIERLLQALRLNPLNPHQNFVHLNLAVACFLSGDYASGVEWGLLCRRASPNFFRTSTP